jgi:hypothetical protein
MSSWSDLARSTGLGGVFVGVTLGGALSFLIYRMFPNDALWIFLIGGLVLALALGAYKLVLRWLDRRKAREMEQGVLGNAAALPQGITGSDQRAKFDDLRRKFQEGLARLREEGTDIYELPWFAIVGESGSGKTEAIRNSGLTFPAGRDTALIGAGGTINMDWWFPKGAGEGVSDRAKKGAVLLDTAGEMIMREMPAGATREWTEFLKLLKTHRPNCPINGVILAIPANSLLVDTADEVNRKADKIAREFKVIQKTLGLRFPVFVLVTKSDLICGFREFFENMDDPQLKAQYQMLGWSNPAPLEEPFRLESVGEGLKSVGDRLRRRRLTFLLDPVGAESPEETRTDQVDALYPFPDGLERIAPRLKRYIDVIFGGDAFSDKPPFLRGLYFTSAMREGSSIDAELAEAMGIPVTSLVDTRHWERNRAYFLRDLFQKKVFCEAGLVTGAANPQLQHRLRKAAVLAAGFAAALLLGYWTWSSATEFNEVVGKSRDYWNAAAQPEYWGPSPWTRAPYFAPVVKSDGTWDDRPIRPAPQPEVSVSQFHRDLCEKSKEEIRPPAVFWLVAKGFGDLEKDRRKARQLLFEQSVLRPVVDRCRDLMLQSKEPAKAAPAPDFWSDAHTEALAELLRLEAGAVCGGSPDKTRIALELLLVNVRPASDAKAADQKTDLELLTKVLEQLYAKDGGAANWPPEEFRGTPYATKAIDEGIKRFRAHWQGQVAKAKEPLSALAAALGEFDKAEQDLLAVSRNSGATARPMTLAQAETNRDDFRKRCGVLLTAGDKLTKALDAELKPPSATLEEAYRQALEQAAEEARAAFARLLCALERPPASSSAAEEVVSSKPGAAQIDRWRKDIEGRRDEVLKGFVNVRLDKRKRDELARLQALFLAPVSGKAVQGFLEDLKKQERRVGALHPPSLLEQVGAEHPPYTLPAAGGAESPCRLYVARSVLYLAAGEFAGSPVPSGPTISTIGSVLDELAKSSEKALSRINGLKVSPPPADAEAAKRTDEAHLLASTAVHLAASAKLYRVIEAALKSAPGTESEVTKHVADVARKPDGVGAYRFPPDLPLVTIPPYDDGYEPEAAASVLQGWFGVGKKLKVWLDSGGNPGKSAAGAIASDDLDKQYQQKSQAYVSYASSYLQWWSGTVPTSLEVKAPAVPSWSGWQADLLKAQPDDVLPKLEKLGRMILQALKGLKPVAQDLPVDVNKALDKAIEAARGQVDNFALTTYGTRLKVKLNAWMALGADTVAAAMKVRAMTPAEFVGDYLRTPVSSEQFVDYYWYTLWLASLEVLAQDAKGKVGEKLASFRPEFARFPLVKPNGKPPLEAADVARARKIVVELIGPSKAETIGGVADLKALGRPDAEPSLQELRDWVDKTWRPKLEALLTVLKALPEGGIYKCVVYIPTYLEQLKEVGAENRTLVRFWRRVMPLGKKDEKDARGFDGPQRVEWGTVEYPCEKDLVMEFGDFGREDPGTSRVATNRLPIPLPKPWAPFHLLLNGKSKLVSRLLEGKQCRVRIEVPAKDGGLVLLLDLEFLDAGIPPIDAWDWPSK